MQELQKDERKEEEGFDIVRKKTQKRRNHCRATERKRVKEPVLFQ